MQAQLAVTVLVTTAVVVYTCACTSPHTSDSALTRRFVKQRPQFEALLHEFQNDAAVISILPKLIVTKTDRLEIQHASSEAFQRTGVARERFETYIQAMTDLKVTGGILRGNEGEVYFRTDDPSFANGDTEKGYLYSENRPAPVVEDLDSYRPPNEGWLRHRPYRAYKAIAKKWYLYFIRN